MDIQTFLFADLSGFTALTEVHGDFEAAELVGNFNEVVRRLLPVHRGEEVKIVGDAIMIRVPEAREAVKLGLEIVHTFHLKPGFPVIHVGMHTGPAVKQGSDWLGAAVNIAARVAGAAGVMRCFSPRQLTMRRATLTESTSSRSEECASKRRRTCPGIQSPRTGPPCRRPTD